MLEGYENITNVDFTLTEPSQISGEKLEGGEWWLAPLSKQDRGEGSFDHTFVLIAGSHGSAKRESHNKTDLLG